MSIASEPFQASSRLDFERLALVATATRNMVLLLDGEGRIEWANDAFERCTGYKLPDIRGQHPAALLTGPDTSGHTIESIRQRVQQGQSFEKDILQYTADGTPFWVHTYCVPIDPHTGSQPGYVVIQTNISDRKNSERSLRIAASVFDRSHDAIIITDTNNQIIDANPAFTDITGYTRAEVLGRNPSVLSSGRHSEDYYRAMWETIERNNFWRGEVWNRRKDGVEFIEQLSISRVHLDEPGRYYHVAAFSDITALKNHARELDRAANYDVLTGLPNRQLLEERIRAASVPEGTTPPPLTIAYLDIDGFKALNDRYGQDVGNQALRATAERLVQNVGDRDTVARIGGDEFVILLQGHQSASVYERILKTVAEPIAIDEETSLNLTSSLGITRYPEDRNDAEALIRHADQAMYAAKAKGCNQFYEFDPGADASRRERRDQLTEIARALDNREFELHFQPQVRVADCQVLGFEALIRWRHPEKGLIPPGQFLPLVENSHLEIPMGQWVMQEAIQQMNRWRQAGKNLEVSININAAHLIDEGFTGFLQDYLTQHPDVCPSNITLEVLETTALEDTKRASNVLSRCRALGVHVALDDFGTGFSSLTYLRTLPVDVIKIDKSFILNMLANDSDRAIVESVIFMAQRFDRQVLAEGVETMELADVLRHMGCNQVQGFGIARPMPAAEVLPWLERWQHATKNPDTSPCLRTVITTLNG